MCAEASRVYIFSASMPPIVRQYGLPASFITCPIFTPPCLQKPATATFTILLAGVSLSGRISVRLWSRERSPARRQRLDRALAHRTLLPLHHPPRPSLSWRNSPPTVASSECRSRV